VDGRGVPLSLVVTGANRHDVSQLQAVLDAIVIKRPSPPERRNKHLCADAGYAGAPALKIIEEHGYIPHVKGRGQEAEELKRTPGKKVRRWVVEVAHSWFAQSLGSVHHGVPKDKVTWKHYLRISSYSRPPLAKPSGHVGPMFLRRTPVRIDLYLLFEASYT